MIVTCEEMAAAEARLFSGGVDAEPYMDQAGRGCAEAIRSFFPRPATAEIAVGKGNNGGDALVVARWLRHWGWIVRLSFSHGPDALSELATKKLAEYEAEPERDTSAAENRIVLVDGLLGIGARGALRGAIRDQADRLNRIRESEFGHCFAIDIPTGLDGDTGEAYEGAVVADCTLTITAPKKGFAADGAERFVGRIVEIPLEIPVEGDPSVSFLNSRNLRPRWPRRHFGTHKGEAGRVVLVAGSRGLSGAAVLTALGASNSGGGLVTVLVEESAYPEVVSRCPPEVMVRPYRSVDDVLSLSPDAVGVGPGLGPEPSKDLIEFATTHDVEVVIDADALNALSRSRFNFAQLPANRILTPHPGELARMTAETGDRVDLTRRLADRWGLTLLHKGARSAIASPGRPVELNTTGHSGMASGGMGDVLTGVCSSLLAQGADPHDAACLGSWLIGRAAEIARDDSGTAAEAVTASMMAGCLGRAIRDLQTGCP